ncbi:retinol dehydrogenase 13-like isoform X2 [Hemiscyllium ocellatum]|uniref:retinol dehydrogenase 13-like isoform X2 n=1 Tax=Hemiscyllium ocellatum TaxID=170820 RepID=UPI00296608B4|nr:retinol dehydrogenase 13-like isoform X2 [Hemiscyllium ocellatum]
MMSKYILPLSIAGTVIGGAVLVKDYATGGMCPSKATVSGKTIIVTGANTGIGKETARELASRGGRIIMACRDMEKCETAAREIRGETLNHHVYAKPLNLASLKSIREFAKQVNEEEENINVLINNAGIMRCPHWKTEDGFEMQFGVNHLGHFLLTNLLLEKLKNSGNGRIINVSSLAHKVGQIDFNDLNWENKKYDTKAAYCQSKLANILFTRELAKRLYGPFFSLLVKSPLLGAQPSIYLAVAEELEGVSGKYFDVNEEKDPAPQALDDETAKHLWEVSAELVGLKNDNSDPQPSNFQC